MHPQHIVQRNRTVVIHRRVQAVGVAGKHVEVVQRVGPNRQTPPTRDSVR